MLQGSHYKRWRIAGPKSPKQNAVSFHMACKSGPCGPDVHGLADDADFLPQNSNPIGATRRPTRPCACWAPANRDPPTWGAFHTEKWPKGCEGIRSCCAVTIVSGTVPRVVETDRDKQVSTEKKHPVTNTPIRPHTRTDTHTYTGDRAFISA